MRWVYQTVHHDLWDMDVGSQPSLVDLHTGSGVVPALVAPTKTGNLFVLDRRTGKPIFPAPERKVPQDTVKDDHAAPTQPFSTVGFMPRETGARKRHVGCDDAGSAGLPDPVPLAALCRNRSGARGDGLGPAGCHLQLQPG